VLLSSADTYQAPSWLNGRAGNAVICWRVTALNESGKQLDQTDWRSIRFGQ
jgi:phage terminase small subunit